MKSEEKPNSILLGWLCRDFNTTERWKALARRFYLATVSHPHGDGDSEKARYELAAYLQSLFKEFVPQEIAVDKWSPDYSKLETINVPPPLLSDNVHWDNIADYFLLAASVSWKEFEEINESRSKLNQSYKDRVAANKERIKKNNDFIKRVFGEITEKHDDIILDNIITEVRHKHFPAKDKQGRIKDEKERSSDSKKILGIENPVPLIDEEKGNVETFILPMVSLYQPKYFVTPKDFKQESKQEELWTS